LTFCSAYNPPALFHTGDVHGVHPSEVFSLHKADTNSSTDLPLLMLLLSEVGSDLFAKEKAEALLKLAHQKAFSPAASQGRFYSKKHQRVRVHVI